MPHLHLLWRRPSVRARILTRTTRRITSGLVKDTRTSSGKHSVKTGSISGERREGRRIDSGGRGGPPRLVRRGADGRSIRTSGDGFGSRAFIGACPVRSKRTMMWSGVCDALRLAPSVGQQVLQAARGGLAQLVRPGNADVQALVEDFSCSRAWSDKGSRRPLRAPACVLHDRGRALCRYVGHGRRLPGRSSREAVLGAVAFANERFLRDEGLARSDR